MSDPVIPPKLGHSQAKSKKRLIFLDQLRALLIALVIIHHTMIIYNPVENGFPLNINSAGEIFSNISIIIIAINQAFFMGMFFLISGYFVPGAVRKKGPWKFLKERITRLGIPLLLTWFILSPITHAMVSAYQSGNSFLRCLTDYYVKDFHLESGALWFVIVLLLFSFGYVIWFLVTGAQSRVVETKPVPASRTWLITALTVGLLTLIVRYMVPMGQVLPGAEILRKVGLGYFAQNISYFPAYIFLFAVGCQAANHQWIERINGKQAKLWGSIALGGMAFYAIAVMGLANSAVSQFEQNESFLFLRLYITPFIDQFIAWGVIGWLFWFFRTHEQLGGLSLAKAGEDSFGAYIFHFPIITGLAIVIEPGHFPTLLNLLLVSLGGMTISFAITRLLRLNPSIRTII